MDKHEALDWFLRRKSMQLADKCQEAENIAIDCIMMAIDAGKWTTKRTQEHDGEWYCSECGYERIVMSDDMKYCPGCGRKMTMPEPPKEG